MAGRARHIFVCNPRLIEPMRRPARTVLFGILALFLFPLAVHAALYAGKDRLPRVLGGMGTAILSTSRGVVTSRTAEAEGIGGEVLCYVW